MRDSPDKAKYYALKLLSYRGRSEKELEERLFQKGFPGEVVSSTIEHLKGIGLVDDLSLAGSLAREAVAVRMLSRRGARAFLMRRGIPSAIAEKVLSFTEKSDAENAVRIAEKRLRSMGGLPGDTVKRRLYGFLSRRGYSYGTIMQVIKHINMKEEQ